MFAFFSSSILKNEYTFFKSSSNAFNFGFSWSKFTFSLQFELINKTFCNVFSGIPTKIKEGLIL